MENIRLSTLLEIGEALENCLDALASLGVSNVLCERVEGQEALDKFTAAFNFKEGTRFSTVKFDRCPVCGKPEREHLLIPVWRCPTEGEER